VILDRREAGGRERVERSRRDLGVVEIQVARRRDRPAISVPRLLAEVGVFLEADEVREHVVEAPAGIPERRPAVVVGRRAAGREPRQPGGAAEQLLPPHGPDGSSRMRLGLVAPLERLGLDRPAVAKLGRCVGAPVRAGLEQQYGV
jgi:hypothetical protein